ncbi:MAG: DUF962 domain-containing protein [Casimicrobium sp.]
MKNCVENLTMYAAYHRDKRNIVTHFLGIPLIVLAVVMLLSRPAFAWVGGVAVTPALVLAVIAAIYYVSQDFWLGLALAAFLALCVWIGQSMLPFDTSVWAIRGVGIFVLGWVLQFIGHYYEQKKPAFVDDLMGLMIGPMFVTAEIAFALGLRKDLREPIEKAVGPTLIRPPKVA